MKTRTIVILVAALIGAIGLYVYQAGEGKVLEAEQPKETASTLAAFIKHPAPKDIAAFSFADDKGAVLDLSHWKGKVVLLNLWATWCGPCRKEMPELAKLQHFWVRPILKWLPSVKI